MVHDSTRDVGLLTLRLGLGATLFSHGAQKLFGWYGGGGLDKTGAGFHKNGWRPGRPNAMVAGLVEVGGGALVALGLATPAAGAAVAGTMVVASAQSASKGFFNMNGGYEYPAVLALSTATLALTGPGRLSLDHAIEHRVNRPWMRILAVALIAPAATAMIVRRNAILAAEAEAAEAAAPETDERTTSPVQLAAKGS